MTTLTSPKIETTKDFILIKIPRRLFGGGFSGTKLSSLEQGLQSSLREVKNGKLIGPFRNSVSFLRALKSNS